MPIVFYDYDEFVELMDFNNSTAVNKRYEAYNQYTRLALEAVALERQAKLLKSDQSTEGK